MAPPIRKRAYRAQSSTALLAEVPDHDYDFKALLTGYHSSVNFTAVEIIVFLPRLFLNEQIALRFANNNIQNPDHVKILKRHRRILVSTNTIGGHYRAAFQPYHFVNGREEPTGKTWSRKQHKVPLNWDHTSLAINNFVPDRILRNRSTVLAPRSVPFGSLANNVIQWPEGDDTADLTRALRFVCNKPEEAQAVLGHKPMFPDDLVWVLQHVNHAKINTSCEDRKVARRYRNMAMGDIPDTPSSGGYTPNTTFTQSGTESNLHSSMSPAEMRNQGPPSKNGEGFSLQDSSMLFMPWLNPHAQSSYLGFNQTGYTYGCPEAAAITPSRLNYRPPTPQLESSPHSLPQPSLDYDPPGPRVTSSDAHYYQPSNSLSQSFDHQHYEHPSFNLGLTGSPLGTLAGPGLTVPDDFNKRPSSTRRPLHPASAFPQSRSPLHPPTPLFTAPSRTVPSSPLPSTPQSDLSSSAAFLPLHTIDLSLPPPHPSISSETFQAAIRYALRPDQLSVPWTCSTEHIKTIMEVLRREDEQFRQLAEWNGTWVVEKGERQKEMVGEGVGEEVEAREKGDWGWLVGEGEVGADGASVTNVWNYAVEMNGVNGVDRVVGANDGEDAMNMEDTNGGEGAGHPDYPDNMDNANIMNDVGEAGDKENVDA